MVSRLIKISMSNPESGFLKKLFFSRWFFAFGVLVLIILSVAFFRAYYRNYQVEQEIKNLKEQINHLEAKRLETLDILQYVKSPAYAEEKARTELNLVKKGEQIAVITDSISDTDKGRQEKEKMVNSNYLSNPLKWWRYFFGNNN